MLCECSSSGGCDAKAPFVAVFDVEDGQIRSHAAYWDQLTFMGQLGLLPKALTVAGRAAG